MYRHLMVPVDGSVLSTANVDAAVALAARLDARITFFHAQAEFAATSEAALTRATAPQTYVDGVAGQSQPVLSKAIACAAAAGVKATGVSKISDRPAEAIVEAAQAQGVDLIVMASRGARGMTGWLHSSQTERVFKRASVALLVTRVARNDPLTAQERALAVIHDEHRAIAVVVHSMVELVNEGQAAGASLDLDSLGAMLTYLQAFPLQQHHPKEEQFLHRWLRLRAPDQEPLLRELEAQHAAEHALVVQTIRCLDEVALGEPAVGQQLVESVRRLADGVQRHMGLEERQLLPLARQLLQPQDWSDIAQAFEANEDTGFGEWPASEFKRLFTRITNLRSAGTR